MIDTLGVNLHAKLKPALPTGWNKERWSEGIVTPQGELMPLASGRIRHVTSGIRLGVSGGMVQWAEGELPKLLFPHNGILIKTQNELDQAVVGFLQIIAEACHIRLGEDISIRRIDLVGHAPVPPERLVRVYKNFRLPGIRKDPIHYPSESLFWPGARRKCRIYDKKLKATEQQGEISRIEWELHSKAILAEFGQPMLLGMHSIKTCYSIFHRLCAGFQPRRALRKGNLACILAMANKEGWCYEGVPLVEHIRGCRNPKRFRELMRTTAVQELDLMEVNLSEYFPSDFRDYQPVDVHLFKQRKL